MAVIAGGAAANYQKADDIDIWVLGINDDNKLEMFIAALKAANIPGIKFVEDQTDGEETLPYENNWNNVIVADIPGGISIPNDSIFDFEQTTKPIQIMASVFMNAFDLLNDFDLSTHAIGYGSDGSIFKATGWTGLADSPKVISDPISPDRTLSRYRRFCLRYGLAPDINELVKLCTMPDPEKA